MVGVIMVIWADEVFDKPTAKIMTFFGCIAIAVAFAGWYYR